MNIPAIRIGIGSRGGSSGPNGAPSNPVLVVISDTEIDATDVMNATNADGLEWSISTDQQNWTTSTTATGVKSFTGLTANTKYYFKTRNYKGTVFSAYSDIVNATTFGVTVVITESVINGKYNTYSNLAQHPTDANKVIETYREAAAHVATYPSIVKIRTSTNKGQSFGAITTMYDPGVGRVVIDNFNGYSSDGRFHVLNTVVDETTAANCQLMYHYSDDGISFTSSDITAVITNVTRPLFRLSSNLIENNGVLMAGAYRINAGTTSNEKILLRLVAGTWTAVSIEITSAYENETAIERLGGDNLIAISREDVAATYNYIQYSSPDNGLTWIRQADELTFGVTNSITGEPPSLHRFLMNGEYIIVLYTPRGVSKPDMYAIYGRATDLLELGPVGWNLGTAKIVMAAIDGNNGYKQGSVLHYDNSYSALASESLHHAPGLTVADLMLFYLDTSDFATLNDKLFGIYAADADSNAFNAVNNSNPTVINNLVGELKAHSLYTKIKALYPMIGGTAALHKFNLINPADTDEAFRLTFVNGAGTGCIHSATGAKPDGVGAYADTHLIPISIITAYSCGLGYYSRTDVSEASVEMAAYQNLAGKFPTLGLRLRYNNNAAQFDSYSGTGAWVTDWVSAAVVNSLGFTFGTRTSVTVNKLYKKGKQIGNTNTATAGNQQANCSIWIGARNLSGTLNAPSSKECALAIITNGLTDIEVGSLSLE